MPTGDQFRTVRPITPAEHEAFLAEVTPTTAHASFLQTPAWGRVKAGWRHESLGWFTSGAEPSGPQRLVGVGLVLYRAIPLTRRVFAYLPEGPVLDWAGSTDTSQPRALAGGLQPLVEHLRSRHAFLVRIGPPVVTRAWTAATLKDALADPGITSLTDLPADRRPTGGSSLEVQLAAVGWRPPPAGGEGFAGGQPRYVYWLPLAGRSEDDVFAGMNQLWRRNVRRADKAGVQVRLGTAADLPAFHAIYAETAARDGFVARELGYFQTMDRALNDGGADRLRIYLALHEGDLVAATLGVRVNRHSWYSYGASTTAKRDVRGSNAVQWRMIRDAIAAGCDVYDLRGITTTLDTDDPHAGLIRFKLGTGGEAVEYVGEWELPLNRVLAAAFGAYRRRR